MNGVTATTISVKSQFSQNMMPSMPTMVNRSTRCSASDGRRKTLDGLKSEVIVLSSAPVWWLS